MKKIIFEKNTFHFIRKLSQNDNILKLKRCKYPSIFTKNKTKNFNNNN